MPTEKQEFFMGSGPAQRIGELEKNIRFLLDQVAVEKRACKACSEQIWFVVSREGKRMPMCADGTSHFANCKAAGQFRRAPK